MNNLKQYAGLLNDEAPENHFLAYITPSERDMLVQAGGVKTPTASGIFAYPPGMGDPNYDGSGGGTYGGSGGNRDTGSNYGQFDRAVSQAANNPSPEPSSGGDNNTVDPGFQNALRTQQINAVNNFDYETEAYSNPNVNIDAGYGQGEITNATWNPKTKTADIEQTVGIISTKQYQTANLGAFLDSPDVSDKDKVKALNQLQALQNSDIVGSKLSNLETDFVLNNLIGSLDNIKNLDKYNQFTKEIDADKTTFQADFNKNPLKTVFTSGGVIGSLFKGALDQYRNNKALAVLGYTGKVIKYNPDGSGEFNYGGGFGRDDNQSEADQRKEINNLVPYAANIIGDTPQQPSMVNDYFANMGSNLGVSSAYMDTYNAAKNKISQSLNLTPNNQQYGYGNTFNNTYARSMTSANPFEEELTNQGLI